MQRLWILGLFISNHIISIFSQSGDTLSERCNAPSTVSGSCRAFFLKWTFSDGCCIEFTWGGCGESDNMFDSFEECVGACGGGSKCNDMSLSYLGYQTNVSEPFIAELPAITLVPQSICPIEEYPEGLIQGGVSVVLDGYIMTCGGSIRNVDLSSCYILKKGKWSSKPSLNTKRENAAASVTNGIVVITGGTEEQSDGNFKPLSSTEFLWFGQQWTYGPPLPEPMYYHCMAESSRGLFVAGVAWPTFAIYKLDWAENVWKTVTTRDDWKYRNYQSCVMLDEDRLALIGGGPGVRFSKRFDVLNLESVTWSKMADLPVNYSQQTAFLYANTVYVFNLYPSGEVYKLPLTENSWSPVKSLGYILQTPVFGAPIVRKDMLCG